MANDDDTGGESLFDPRAVLSVNRSPIQTPGLPRLVRTAIVGGPDHPGDRRVYLSADLLGRCLEIARSSPMGRVVLDHAGVRVDLYQRDDGHQYEVWTLIGYGPKPEPVPDFIRGFGGG